MTKLLFVTGIVASLTIFQFRARYRKGFRTVFVPVSSELNENAEDEYMVNAALVAGLYPKILIAEGGNGLKTLGNNQAISIVRELVGPDST